MASGPPRGELPEENPKPHPSYDANRAVDNFWFISLRVTSKSQAFSSHVFDSDCMARCVVLSAGVPSFTYDTITPQSLVISDSFPLFGTCTIYQLT